MEPHHHHHHEHHHQPAPDWSPAPDPPSAPADWFAAPMFPSSPAQEDYPSSSDGYVAPASRWLPDQPVGSFPAPAAARHMPPVSAARGTAALVCGVASVLVGFCDFGLLAFAAIVLGVAHRRRVGLGGPGRRRALAGLVIGAVVVLPSLVLSIGFFLPQPPR